MTDRTDHPFHFIFLSTHPSFPLSFYSDIAMILILTLSIHHFFLIEIHLFYFFSFLTFTRIFDCGIIGCETISVGKDERYAASTKKWIQF